MSQLCHLCLSAPVNRRVAGYNIDVCDRCWNSAAQGWEEGFEPTLFAALARASLLIPDRNANGRLPRDYAPPADFQL